MNEKFDLTKLHRLFTHAAPHHADDCFAYAAITMILENLSLPAVPLNRVGELPEDYDPQLDLAFDIGGGRYDHHQPRKRRRTYAEKRVPYAAFGLIVRDFYEELGLTFSEYTSLDHSLIMDLDATDNHELGHKNELSFAFAMLNANWDDPDPLAADLAFSEAVQVARTILRRYISRVKSKSRAKELASVVGETIEYRMALTDRYAPIGDFLAGDEVDWLCYPSPRVSGEWYIHGLRGTFRDPETKKTFRRVKAKMPVEFWGLPKSELPAGMVFCQDDGSMAIFSSLPAARAFAKKYLSEKQPPDVFPIQSSDTCNSDRNDEIDEMD